MQQQWQGRGTRRTFLALVVVFFVWLGGLASRAQTADDEKKINDTIAKMTLEEKDPDALRVEHDGLEAFPGWAFRPSA